MNGAPLSLSVLRDLDRRFVIETYARMPVAFVRGEGVRLWDDEGNEYLDFLAGISVANVGHCHPAVVEAVAEQSRRLWHVSNLFYTEQAMLLAKCLSESSLVNGRVLFANSGAEANEAAIKLARKRRPGGEFVVVHRAFHGRTYGALSATPQESKQAPFAPLVPGFVTVAPEAEALTAAVGPQTAAVLLEPIQGETGVHVLPDELLQAARVACDDHGAALIFDEIQTGMGRTGTLWAYEQTPVTPDAFTSAKALAGGLPIGALVAGPLFADVLEPGDHGSTFAGGPLVCAAALAVFELVDDPILLGHVVHRGAQLAEGVAELPHVVDVRGRGLMIGFDVDVSAPAIAKRALLEQRLVINATGPQTLRLLPPLVVDERDCEEALARLGAVLGDAS